MTIGSLFSGIGGLELGLEWAGLGPTIWQVEIDPKLRNCLRTHWPESEIFEDIKTCGKKNLKPVDIICGGFPCQDVSSAGKRVGLSGSRSGLWYEMARIINELRPLWVVVENVASGATKWTDEIRSDLAEFGYATLPIPLEARFVGLPHRRARIFVIAHLESKRRRQGLATQTKWARRINAPARNFSHDWRAWTTQPFLGGDVSRISGRSHRICALGNSVVPQCAEVVGEVIKLLDELEGE